MKWLINNLDVFNHYWYDSRYILRLTAVTRLWPFFSYNGNEVCESACGDRDDGSEVDYGGSWPLSSDVVLPSNRPCMMNFQVSVSIFECLLSRRGVSNGIDWLVLLLDLMLLEVNDLVLVGLLLACNTWMYVDYGWLRVDWLHCLTYLILCFNCYFPYCPFHVYSDLSMLMVIATLLFTTVSNVCFRSIMLIYCMFMLKTVTMKPDCGWFLQLVVWCCCL